MKLKYMRKLIMIGPYKYIEKSIMAVRPISQKYPLPIRGSGINLTDLRNLCHAHK